MRAFGRSPSGACNRPSAAKWISPSGASPCRLRRRSGISSGRLHQPEKGLANLWRGKRITKKAHAGRWQETKWEMSVEVKRPAQLLILGTTLLLALRGPAAQIYISTSGSDTNSGTRAKPFATLERARDEVRRLSLHRKLASGGLTVWLNGGDYFRTNALQLTAADSA